MLKVQYWPKDVSNLSQDIRDAVKMVNPFGLRSSLKI